MGPGQRQGGPIAHPSGQPGDVIADLVKDRESGMSRGFAFVTMPTQAEADKAISMFNAYSLADRELKVNVAKPKVERAK